MAFNLTRDELEEAMSAIEHHGYSTMLPHPPEWQAVRDNWADIRSEIESIDLDTYEPFQPMSVFAPKNRSTVRALHLLHPQDLIVYTALILIVRDDIENSRISRRSNRVFSFRSSGGARGVLYETRGGYQRFRAKGREKAARRTVQFVAVADIADFYSRIYQHPLQNVIESVASTSRGKDVARVLVAKFISKLMGKKSYGIPVGPYASRVLAEAVLIDVDAHLEVLGADFIRWVDDFVIYCRSERQAQATLYSLGEWLFVRHGLTLQAIKTRIVSIDQYRDEIDNDPGRLITPREEVVRTLREIQSSYEEVDDDDVDEGAIDRAHQLVQAVDLRQMLDDAVSDVSLIDYEIVKYVLTRIPLIRELDGATRYEILDVVLRNAENLYPVAEYIATYVRSLTELSGREQRSVARRLFQPLRSARSSPPPFYSMWVLHIFAVSADWDYSNEVLSLYRSTTSEVVRRYAALALAASGTRAHALAIKDGYGAASPLHSLALLFASRKLGVDERRHWRQTLMLTDAVEKRVASAAGA